MAKKILCGKSFLYVLCFLSMAALAGCAGTVQVTQFKQGVSDVQSESLAVMGDFNKVVRVGELDRAETLASLTKDDMAPGLKPAQLAQWNAALETVVLYASALETLAAAGEKTEIGSSLQSIGDRIQTLGDKEKESDTDGALSKTIGDISGFLVKAGARRRALDIARDSDKAVRKVLKHMAVMLDTGKEDDPSLRTTMSKNWDTQLASLAAKFSGTPEHKRKVAAAYADTLDNFYACDTALSALRGALLDLAELHTAMAHERTGGVCSTAALLRQELAAAKLAVDSIQTSKIGGDDL